MSCPTCNRTMQSIGKDDPAQRTFWCATCGTLKEYNGDFYRIELPGWLRQVIASARLRSGQGDSSQHVTVDAHIKISQHNDEAPRLELVALDHNGRRLV